MAFSDAALGALLVLLATPLGALAVFSGGAMLFVVFVELLPDAFRCGLERIAAASFAAGAFTAFALASLLPF